MGTDQSPPITVSAFAYNKMMKLIGPMATCLVPASQSEGVDSLVTYFGVEVEVDVWFGYYDVTEWIIFFVSVEKKYFLNCLAKK